MREIILLRGQRHKVIECGSCGVIHTVPEAMHNSAARGGGYWHCPNGHSRGWKDGTDKTDLENMRRERDRLAQRVAERDDEIEHQKKQVAAQKGVNTKLKKRVGNGVCPCCNRHFSNLHRHMHSKHPDYTEGEPLTVIAGGKPMKQTGTGANR